MGKGENAGNQHFLLFLQSFLPFPPKKSCNFSFTFILSSVNVFNLDQSKILSFSKRVHGHQARCILHSAGMSMWLPLSAKGFHEFQRKVCSVWYAKVCLTLFIAGEYFNPLPDNKILSVSILIAVAKDKLTVTQDLKFFSIKG